MSRTRWDMEEHAEENDRLTAMLVTSQRPRVIAGGSRAGGQGSLTFGGKGRCGRGLGAKRPAGNPGAHAHSRTGALNGRQTAEREHVTWSVCTRREHVTWSVCTRREHVT